MLIGSNKHLALLILLLQPAVSLAANSRILSAEELSGDAGQQLAGELAVFESIGQGIALSLAVCADAVACEPALSEAELQQLIDTIDSRIQHLDAVNEREQLRQGYQQTREQYALYLRELRDLDSAARRSGEALDAEIEAKALPAAGEPVTKPAPEQTAELPPAEPPQPQFENRDYDLEYFEDTDELIRSD